MKWKYLWPSRRRAEEREMREELESLARMAGPGELGNLTLAAENARETWGWSWLEGLVTDLRHALRTLRRQPGYVAVAVLSLALGIGANSAIFSFADAILFRPLPVSRPSEILGIANATPDNPVEGISYPDYRDIRARSRLFSGLIAYRSASLGVRATPAEPPRIRAAMMVSGNFFNVLGIVPSPGRAFLPEEGSVPGRDAIAILGYDYWKTQCGGDPSAMGRTIRLNRIEFTIVGVTPKSFPGMDRFFPPSIYVPLSMWGSLVGEREDPLADRGRHELYVKGRLAAGASRESARAELAGLGRGLEAAYPKTNRSRNLTARTEFEASMQQAPWRFVGAAMLMALAGLVLIIACANVASLALARGRARTREMAIRLSIGAGRFQVIRQLLTESLVVALLGGLAGLAVGYAGIQFFGTIQVPSDVPFDLGMRLDQRVLAFSLFAALVSCVLFGLVPALQASRVPLAPALKSGGGAISTGRRTLGRNSLVVSQIALATVLLIAAGVFLGGFRKILALDQGFRKDHLISMDLDPSVLLYSPEQTHDFYRKLMAQVGALPGVRRVALAETLPFSTNPASVRVVPEGYRFPKGRDTVTVSGGAFDEGYFGAMRVEIGRGRAFNPDDRAGSRRVAIINEEFAKTYWPNQDPIGKRLRLDSPDGPAAEVAGVAKTERYAIATETPKPYVYLPYEQNQRSRMTLIAESLADPVTLAAPLRDAVRRLDADLPIYNLRTVAALASFYTDRFLVLLQMVAAMGLLGLMLAMAGLYGLISYSVTRRTKEIGLRMAIGASQADVLKLVFRQGLTLAVAGIAAGGVLAAAVAPAIANWLRVGPVSAATCIIVTAALLAVSVAACYLPARRAAMLDPLLALRYE